MSSSDSNTSFESDASSDFNASSDSNTSFESDTSSYSDTSSDSDASFVDNNENHQQNRGKKHKKKALKKKKAKKRKLNPSNDSKSSETSAVLQPQALRLASNNTASSSTSQTRKSEPHLGMQCPVANGLPRSASEPLPRNATQPKGPNTPHSTGPLSNDSEPGSQLEVWGKVIEFLSPYPSPPDPDQRNVGYNFYNPIKEIKPPPRALRPIIIDASNVAMGHGLSVTFSVRGIVICIEYFLVRGHKVHAFLPQFRKRLAPITFDRLEKRGLVVFTPSRWNDRHQLIASYDDRYIVQCAVDMGGVIVSKDNYRDLITEQPDWAYTIRNRLLMYTWVGDRLIFPLDPLGRNGPTLYEFLRF